MNQRSSNTVTRTVYVATHRSHRLLLHRSGPVRLCTLTCVFQHDQETREHTNALEPLLRREANVVLDVSQAVLEQQIHHVVETADVTTPDDRPSAFQWPVVHSPKFLVA